MKKKRNSQPAFTDEKAMEIAETLVKMIKEIEKLAIVKIASLLNEEETDSFFIKTDFGKSGMEYSLEVYNSDTKTIAVKNYLIIETLQECQAGVIDYSIEKDVSALYELSKKNFYNEPTKILL